MAVRERDDKEQIIEELATAISEKLLTTKPGTTQTIYQLVDEIYTPKGYKYIHIGPKIGYAWSRDGGETFSITDWEEEEVLSRVARKISGKRKLDFSIHGSKIVGAPHNIPFILRRCLF